MAVTHDIVAKLWNLCNVLKDDGVTYHQYVTELTYLLFLKMVEETEQEDKLPEGYRWRDLVEKSAPDRLEHYKLMLIHLGTHGNRQVSEIFANATSFIRMPKTLSTLVTSIDELDWYSARQEGLGDLYEGLLEKNANEKKSGAGQYFTPRVLINVMVELMQPKIGEIIQDPAAGTGGFLIAANHYIRKHVDIFDLSEEEFHRYKNKNILRDGARPGHSQIGHDEHDASRAGRRRPRIRHDLRGHALAQRPDAPQGRPDTHQSSFRHQKRRRRSVEGRLHLSDEQQATGLPAAYISILETWRPGCGRAAGQRFVRRPCGKGHPQRPDGKVRPAHDSQTTHRNILRPGRQDQRALFHAGRKGHRQHEVCLGVRSADEYAAFGKDVTAEVRAL